jgi:hypothetical protein
MKIPYAVAVLAALFMLSMPRPAAAHDDTDRFSPIFPAAPSTYAAAACVSGCAVPA